MKKQFLKDNLIFFGLLFLISLFYAGFQAGTTYGMYYANQHLERYTFRIADLLLPAVYLVFLLIGLRLFYERELLKPRTHWINGSCALGFALVWLITRFVYHSRGTLHTYMPLLDVYIFPIGVTLISAWIFINCIRCAVETRREDRQYKVETT